MTPKLKSLAFAAAVSLCAAPALAAEQVKIGVPSWTGAQAIAYLEAAGMPIPPAGGRYSVNAGLWGLTIGGGEMNGTEAALPEEAWCWTRGGGGERRLTIDFQNGRAVAIDVGDPARPKRPRGVSSSRLGREGSNLQPPG